MHGSAKLKPQRWPVLALLIVSWSAIPTAFACTCFGTQTIGAALVEAEDVVVARLEAHVWADYESDESRPALMRFEVEQTLRGGATREIDVSSDFVCHQSFWTTDFHVGKRYVLPLSRVRPSAEFAPNVAMSGPEPWARNHVIYQLPGCSHNALLLEDGRVYTSEPESGRVRRLQYYSSFGLLKVLVTSGLARYWNLLSLAAALSLTFVGIAAFVSRRRTGSSRSGMRLAAIAFSWIALAALGWALKDFYDTLHELPGLFTLFPLTILIAILVANHAQPPGRVLWWCGLLASIACLLFGGAIVVFSVLPRQDFTRDEGLFLLFILAPAITSILSLLGRRHERRPATAH